MLPELPVEIHRKIYAMACMDDGSAGCALSLVSRAVHEVSSDYRWYSIAISGRRQAHYLLKALSALPTNRRNVIHLYISDGDRPSRRTARLGSRDAEYFQLNDDDDVDRDREEAVVLYNRLVNFDDELPFERETSIPAVGCSIMELLQLLAPTLQTLSLVLLSRPGGLDPFLWSLLSDTPLQPDLDLSRLSFPRLTELTLRGVYKLPSSSTLAPALRLLNIADESIRTGVEEDLALNHPELTHLRISRYLKIEDHHDTIVRLAVVMGVRAPSEQEEQLITDKKLSRLPGAASRFYLVEPGPTRIWSKWTSPGYRRGLRHHQGWKTVTPLGYDSMVRDFTKLMELYPNFVLLPGHPGGNKGKEAGRARVQWLDRVEGGPGCWSAPGKEITGI
ncbi:hypothetical protein CALVIDRAFT_600328 [Calocera viscosa TUFC12733]|uniref:Uncharacterized protein n=1 Tax=Calocera viscosa (strain TUFC12733) TaxID=1330018 RepID=A0A167JRU4_CALVF|nr:hypothetical protein CALVIDRAFT_600328 [Calocera viscosa TUFC12733]